MHAARMSARVFISLCGTVLLVGAVGVAARATPVERVSRFAALANAFLIPTVASAELELETWVASVAYPARAYAAAIVETSFTSMKGVAVRKFPALGQFP